MAPFDVSTLGSLGEPVVHVVLGIAFGFVLERSGFGSAKKLTSQFYLDDMTVLKVMFTAIVTTMVLVLFATTLGLLDYDRLFVNPTYLGSGIVGGLVFGVGFVVGGFCPGTALVAAATLKLDGLLFILGVLVGIFVFGYTTPLVDAFWNDSGNYGTLTLFDWLGLPMPLMVFLVVALALTLFIGGEWIEGWMRRRSASRRRDTTANCAGQSAIADPVTQHNVILRGLAIALLGTTAVLGLLWQRFEVRRNGALSARVEESIRTNKVQVSARELADLLAQPKLALAVLDLRSESEYNRFHLLDAKRLDGSTLGEAPSLPAKTIKVLVSDNEGHALSAYRRLAHQRMENLYVLAGGVPSWLQLFPVRDGEATRVLALGDNHVASRPPPRDTSVDAHPYVPVIRVPGLGAKKAGGGCGG